MDPTACWERLLTAIAFEEFDEAKEACQDLAKWLQGGGFMPKIESDELEFLLEILAARL